MLDFGADEVAAESLPDVDGADVDHLESPQVGLDHDSWESSAPAIDLNGDDDFSELDHIDTINEDLDGKVHPGTGVPFEEHEVDLPSGEHEVGVFPNFDETYATSIPESMYDYSDADQFHYANMQLSYNVETDPSLAD